MAVTSGQGYSRVYYNRHYDDYASLKQYFKNKNFEEVVISGSCTTGGAAAEISFVTGDVINYIAAEGQVYLRTEADDANQHSKYVYIEYQDDTGAVKTVRGDDMDASNSTTEQAVASATDFYRLRRMISEVESASGGGKMVLLTDADADGVADYYGIISDGQSEFSLERFFTQPDSTHTSYLGRVKAWCATTATDANPDSFFIDVTFTPKPQLYSNVAGDLFPTETQVAADMTLHLEVWDHLDWQPLIELDGGTEVIFKVGDNGDASKIFIEATMIEFVGANVR